MKGEISKTCITARKNIDAFFKSKFQDGEAMHKAAKHLYKRSNGEVVTRCKLCCDYYELVQRDYGVINMTVTLKKA